MLIFTHPRQAVKSEIRPALQLQNAHPTRPGRGISGRHITRVSILVARFALAFWRWARSGFPLLNRSAVHQRLRICQHCVSWRPHSFFGLGQCAACGCTGLKRWLPTENCPQWKPAPPLLRPVPRLAKSAEVSSLILSHYARLSPVRRRPLPDLHNCVLFQPQNGLGETLMLTDLAQASIQIGRPMPVGSHSPHFAVLRLDHHQPPASRPRIPLFDLSWNYECGAGHLIQRLRRAFQIPVDPWPKPFIRPNLIPRDLSGPANRVILHFEPGQHVRWQRAHLHPRARQLYPENARIIEKWMAAHPSWEFCQIGRQGPVLRGAKPCLGWPLEKTIRLIAQAEWFIGIMSGPLHLAVALGLKCIVIINFPDPSKIFLPNLVSTGQVEEEWFYPQNVHLHQDAHGPLVPRFSRYALEAALAGEVYPFWSQDFPGSQFSNRSVW